MGFMDDAKNKGEELMGKAKEGLGKVTGNDELQGEGQGEQAGAKVENAGNKIQEGAEGLGDRTTGFVDGVKDKLDGDK